MAKPLYYLPLPHAVGTPEYHSPGAAGFDLQAAIEGLLVLHPGDRALVPTGLAFAVPYGYELQIRPRSGQALRRGLTVLNSPGTVDSDYRGEVKVLVYNAGNDSLLIEPGERIAQAVFCPVEFAQLVRADSLDHTERGEGGFGSTGT